MPLRINENIVNNEDFIKDCYLNNNPQGKSEYFSLIASPFKVLKLKNILSSPVYLKELRASLETLELNKKDNDLYSLWQSEDLNNSQLEPVKNFIHILQKDISPLLSNICNVKLNEKLSITASLYNYGDVLLCHDDKCEDRCIAFVYYLTGSEKSGGSFDMFGHDGNNQPTEILHSLPPEEDSLVIFEVGNLTYHQVSEVTDYKFHRWSINGWFHSERKIPLLKYEDPLPTLQQQITVEGLMFLNEHINPLYCTPSNLGQMKEEFSNESFLLLRDIFTPKTFKLCSKEMKNNKLNWTKAGPANRRNHYVADLSDLPSQLDTIVKLLRSPMFISFLKNITSLSLEPYEGNEKPSSKFILQLIKWLPGCYTMATDNDNFFKKPGLDLYIFFCAESLSESNSSSGYITYLDTADEEDKIDDEQEEMDDEPSDKELLTIEPENNALSLVYRTDNTVRFTKYINQSITKEYYAFYATYYEVDNN